MMIIFFSAAKLFKRLPCRSFSVLHFANETLLQTITRKLSKIQGQKLAKRKPILVNFQKKFLYEVVYAFLAGLNL